MSRINPLYTLMLFFTITLLLLFNVNIKKEKLSQSNTDISHFHKQLNEYIQLNKTNLSKNMIVEKIKRILEDELPENLNVEVKTFDKHIEINIKSKKNGLKEIILDAFYKSDLQIKQLSMDTAYILIKVKI